MSVAGSNIAPPGASTQALLALGPWLRHRPMLDRARRLIAEFKVKTDGPDAPIATLSGGNVQRAVLARELSGNAAVLIAANPVFGLDFAAVAEIHDRILAARNYGAAVLLVSEDLDELLALFRPDSGHLRRAHRPRDPGGGRRHRRDRARHGRPRRPRQDRLER